MKLHRKLTQSDSERRNVLDRLSRLQPCCERGKRVFCVCSISVRCPSHGELCYGTHD